MSLLKLLLAPTPAFAALQHRTFALTTGIRIPLNEAVGNLTGFVAISSISVCTLLFLVGAAQLTLSHGDQTKVDNGKKMMISALIGLSIVLSAYAITTTVLFFLYEGA